MIFRQSIGVITLVFLTHLLQLFPQASRVLKYNNLHCEVLEKEFFDIEYCRLKVLTRTTKAFQLKGVLKSTISNILVDCRIRRKFNGWRPFLYDFKFEGCDFLRNPNKYVIAKWAISIVRNYTNAVHKCPFVGEVLFMNLPTFDEQQFGQLLSLFPIDTGEYGVFVNYFVDRKLIGSINGSFSYTDYSKQYN